MFDLVSVLRVVQRCLTVVSTLLGHAGFRAAESAGQHLLELNRLLPRYLERGALLA